MCDVEREDSLRDDIDILAPMKLRRKLRSGEYDN